MNIKRKLESEFRKMPTDNYEKSDKFPKKEISFEMSDNEEDQSMNDLSESQKRVRKNRDQIKALQLAYEKTGGNWTKKDQKELASKLGLSE